MKQTINFHIHRDTQGFQIFDALYAYYQSLGPAFESAIDIKISQDFDTSSDLNIFCDYMPGRVNKEQISKYDLIFFSTSCEPLTVSTPLIAKMLIDDPRCFLINNSLLTSDHQYLDKIIWYPGNIRECRKLWTDHFYPHYYTNLDNLTRTRTGNMIFINGENRSWRYYFSQLLQQACPTLPIRSSISTGVRKTNNSDYESTLDQSFRQWVNEYFKDKIVNSGTSYYADSSSAGIDGKFGRHPPGIQILNEYFDYQCVIFPETSWLNNELGITEKALKCFYSGCWPWPVGGANVNRLYNELGFYTAWNLLPIELQAFDSELDHQQRYQLQCTAIAWLHAHPEVFDSESAVKMIKSNQQNFHVSTSELISVQRFDMLIKKFLLQKKCNHD